MIKAFLITKGIPEAAAGKALAHLRRLAGEHSLHLSSRVSNGFAISIVADAPVDDGAADPASGFFMSGSLHGGRDDRFIDVAVTEAGLVVENDYAGSIPLFWSTRNGFAASNIEPCVFLASESSIDDLSPENVYGYLRFSHFIWDETAWNHIFQMVPDSRYHFSGSGQLADTRYLRTVLASDSRAHLTDKQVADELFELNRSLVTEALGSASDIILPLSSGYDSRMIFSVLASDSRMAQKTRCFTYGSAGSIEVESGRRLAGLKNVSWHHVELPCRFLDRRHLKQVADIFGASLHMHGMYQIEFFELLRSEHGAGKNSVLTSGFMTGVPAGQHNGLLRIEDPGVPLLAAMMRFSQSKVWPAEALEQMPLFQQQSCAQAAEARFRAAFDRFDGEVFQKAVMFDVWTRQRGFISYYPRTLDWLTAVVSPHMCARYANFFMSLGREHLWDRRAVELMFLAHYPDVARVASNSNGLAALGSPVESSALFLSNVFARLGLRNLVPQRYRNAPFDFDLQAVRNSGEDSFYPLLQQDSRLEGLIRRFGGSGLFRDLYTRVRNGDVVSYLQTIPLQAIAFDGLLD